MRRKPTTDVNELIEELLVVYSNELRKLREQSGRVTTSDADIVSTAGDMLRVLSYIKRHRDKEVDDDVNNMTTEQLKERYLELIKKQSKREKEDEGSDE